jgi:hypothetical protein
MDWLYHGEPFELKEPDPKSVLGFVYLIENLTNGRFYVGKKLLWFKGFKKERGKKRRRILSESDWKTYYGSNKELQADVAKLGEKNFRRTILHLCSSKSLCSWFELVEQIERKAILSKDAYNDLIRVRIHRKHLRSLQA